VRPEGLLAHIVDRQVEFSDRFRVRWFRFTNGIRIPRRGRRSTDPFRVRWYRFTDGIRVPRRGPGSTDPFRVRWYRFTDGIRVPRERPGSAEPYRVRWYRFSDGIRVSREQARSAHRSDGRIGHGVLSGTQTLLTAFLSVMLAVAAISVIRAAGGTQRPSTKAASTRPTEAAPPAIAAPAGHEVSEFGDGRSGLEVYVNAQAGYRFSYPDSWQLSRSEKTVRLVSSDGGVVMVFGVAPPGPLEEASVRVVKGLTDTYRNAKLVTDGIERTSGGIRFLMVGGKAIHATGAPVGFLAITIQGTDGNQAITVRFAAHSDPLDALPAIRRIIGSYKPFVA
jgi:hypothetical protein